MIRAPYQAPGVRPLGQTKPNYIQGGGGGGGQPGPLSALMGQAKQAGLQAALGATPLAPFAPIIGGLFNDGGIVNGFNPDTFIDGKIRSVHYPTPQPAHNAPVGLNVGGEAAPAAGPQLPPEMMELLQQAPAEVQQALQAFLQGQIGPDELMQVLVQAGVPQEAAQQMIQQLVAASQQGLNRGGKAQPSLAEQINWGGKYDKPKPATNAPKRSWYDPRGWVGKNTGGSVGPLSGHYSMGYNDGGEVSMTIEEAAPVKKVRKKVVRGDSSDELDVEFDLNSAVPPLSAMAMKGLGI